MLKRNYGMVLRLSYEVEKAATNLRCVIEKAADVRVTVKESKDLTAAICLLGLAISAGCS